MSVEVYVFMKALTMKKLSVASVFIELQNLFYSENDRTRLIFTRHRVQSPSEIIGTTAKNDAVPDATSN